jgi:hypothetical protein
MRGGQSGYRRVKGGRVTTPLIVSGAEKNSFDYTILSPDMADEARAAAGRIKDRLRTSTQEIGRELLAIKAKLPHGTFSAWVTAEFGISDRMSQNYMNCAKFLVRKSETVSLLPPSALYALSAPTAAPEVVKAVLADVDAGVPLTAMMIRDKLAVAAAAAQRQADAARSTNLIKKEREAATRRRADAERAAKFLVSKLGGSGVFKLLRLLGAAGLARVDGLFRDDASRTLTAAEIDAKFGGTAPDAECAEAVMATVH